MKRMVLAVLAVLAISSAWSQDDSEVAAQRASITSARAAAESRYKEEEKACYKRFAVNECLAKARTERRLTLADLHRQEVALNDAIRKRKAAERQKSIEQHDTARQDKLDKEQAGEQAQQAGRERRAAEKASAKASQAAAAPGKAAQRDADVARKQAEASAARDRNVRQAQARVAEHEKHLAEAQERRDKLKERLAEQKKPPAKPLPVPE